MERVAVKKIVKRYAKKLEKNKFPVSSMYLFGSQAKGKARKYSDIDIAVISPKFKNRFEENWTKLWRFREGIHNHIEPYGFTEEDFENLADPLVYEIRKTGIKVI